MTASEKDVTRRTWLAAERTWLAWWRTGIAAAAAAVAVGSVVPQLLEDGKTPYVALGAGYAAVAVAIFGAGGVRQVRVERAIERGEYERVGSGVLIALTGAGVLLGLATLVIVVVQP